MMISLALLNCLTMSWLWTTSAGKSFETLEPSFHRFSGRIVNVFFSSIQMSGLVLLACANIWEFNHMELMLICGTCFVPNWHGESKLRDFDNFLLFTFYLFALDCIFNIQIFHKTCLAMEHKMYHCCVSWKCPAVYKKRNRCQKYAGSVKTGV